MIKFHIEVKHVESGFIFWSELEVAKAKENDGRYCIVVVQPGYIINDQKVVWFWNPLVDFLSLRRHGKWLWRTEADGPSDLDSCWDIPSPREATEATNFSFVISLDDGFLKNPKFDLARGLNPIKEKLGRWTAGRRESSYPNG